MLLQQEFRHEVVADEWSKISVAHGCVLCLWDVDVLLFLLLFRDLFVLFRFFGCRLLS